MKSVSICECVCIFFVAVVFLRIVWKIEKREIEIQIDDLMIIETLR